MIAGRKSHSALTLALVLAFFLANAHLQTPTIRADAADQWWDISWPYRIPITASGSGIAEASIDFSNVLNNLGLNNALLDLRSIRVVPYNDNSPGNPLPYAESYSTMLEDADDPQVGWHSSGFYYKARKAHSILFRRRQISPGLLMGRTEPHTVQRYR